MNTDGANTGQIEIEHDSSAADVFSSATLYAPGINVPINIAGAHVVNAIRGAADGTAFTAFSGTAAMPTLASADLQLLYIGNGTIDLFREWDDTGFSDANLEAATT